VEINDTLADVIDIKWINNTTVVHLIANLKNYSFTIEQIDSGNTKTMYFLVSFEK
jgi:sucrose phosphorylase